MTAVNETTATEAPPREAATSPTDLRPGEAVWAYTDGFGNPIEPPHLLYVNCTSVTRCAQDQDGCGHDVQWMAGMAGSRTAVGCHGTRNGEDWYPWVSRWEKAALEEFEIGDEVIITGHSNPRLVGRAGRIAHRDEPSPRCPTGYAVDVGVNVIYRATALARQASAPVAGIGDRVVADGRPGEVVWANEPTSPTRVTVKTDDGEFLRPTTVEVVQAAEVGDEAASEAPQRGDLVEVVHYRTRARLGTIGHVIDVAPDGTVDLLREGGSLHGAHVRVLRRAADSPLIPVEDLIRRGQEYGYDSQVNTLLEEIIEVSEPLPVEEVDGPVPFLVRDTEGKPVAAYADRTEADRYATEHGPTHRRDAITVAEMLERALVGRERYGWCDTWKRFAWDSRPMTEQERRKAQARLTAPGYAHDEGRFVMAVPDDYQVEVTLRFDDEGNPVVIVQRQSGDVPIHVSIPEGVTPTEAPACVEAPAQAVPEPF